MKKVFFVWMMVLCAVVASAENYGILVNGRYYFAGSLVDEFEGFTQYLAHVQVSSGDYCQLYDADNKNAWAKPLNTASIEGFAYDEANQRYTVSVSSCYDFYIKLKWNEDELYIGPGSDCGEGVDITKEDPQPGYSGSVPAQCPDVMLQAFYWNSTMGSSGTTGGNGYGRTMWIDHISGTNGSSAEEIGQWFDLIWIPSVSAGSGLGYHPSDYSDLNSDRGTKQKLTQLIETIHKNGGRVVADIVINHGDAKSGWCGYGSGYNFGDYGKFVPDGSYICQTDEVNYSPEAGSCKGFATGGNDDGYGEEANYTASRDWDHTNANVRNMFKAYLKWLRNVVKIDGFRYDYCKGYHNSHINEYNRAAEAYFSVMEYWDGNPSTLQARLSDAGWNTATFDFATKYTAFNDGIAADNYYKLQGAGLPGAGKARYAVTFVDSHDSFQRDNGNEFCGNGNSLSTDWGRVKVLIANAYMLSMPGVPCVFWPHWVTFKEEIKKMINARYKTGVHSESAVSDEAGNGYYKATITGTNGQIRLLLGPNSGYGDTPIGFTLAVKGTNYGVYYKLNSARGDKNTERTDRTEDVEEIESQKSKVESRKMIQDGKLMIQVGEQVFDVMGRRVK